MNQRANPNQAMDIYRAALASSVEDKGLMQDPNWLLNSTRHCLMLAPQRCSRNPELHEADKQHPLSLFLCC